MGPSRPQGKPEETEKITLDTLQISVLKRTTRDSFTPLRSAFTSAIPEPPTEPFNQTVHRDATTHDANNGTTKQTTVKCLRDVLRKLFPLTQISKQVLRHANMQ